MKRLFQQHHRIIFYGSWLLLNVVQSIFTELQDDEAYYWVYAKYLDWGYFDHPPMVALLIRIGVSVFGGELGVRLLPLLMNTATIWLTEKLTWPRQPFLFYTIALSVAVLQVGGFLAVPDAPLMAFTALFFFAYRKFLGKPSWGHTLLLGAVAACLLYSKYHAVLLFLFVLLSNIKLLRQPKIYAAGLLALLLFIPHLWWQYTHNWISFRYHLFESNVNPYKVSYTTDYVLGQLLLAGPLVGFLLWPAAFFVRAKNAFERSLKFTAVGFFIFFLLSTLKGKVEPNWTSPAIVPLLVLAHQVFQQRQTWRRWLYRLAPITIVIVILFRFIMIFDVLPVTAIVERYHGWKGWPQELHKKTGNLPVVFNNSYQRASKYWFYSGQMTYSLHKFDDRRSNYNFWPVEDSLLGKPVYEMDIFNMSRFQDSVKTPLFTVGYRFDSSYHSFAKIGFRSDDLTAAVNDSLRINFSVEVPVHYQRYLGEHRNINPKLAVAFFDGQKFVKYIELPFTLQDVLQKNVRSVALWPALPKGKYFLRFGVMSDSDLYSHNSDKITLTIE